ncbi:hypothetical protein BVY04_02080 [bacterium M21]|nr:hypothetical protein BVY04_02080 [bacterium M21]
MPIVSKGYIISHEQALYELRKPRIMIIANPIYDVVFKYLMEDLEIAKGIISRIIQEEVVALQFSAQEQVLPRDYSVLSLFRLDFIAQVRTSSGINKKVLIEIQKAKLSSDLSRFRNYLGKQYTRKDEVIDDDGTTRKASLPIVTIYILGFDLSPTLPASIKVKREYLNALTGECLLERADFIEALTHDAYVIQIPKLHTSMKSDLERVLSVFEQEHFVDEKHHEIEFSREARADELLKLILRRLHSLAVEDEVRVRMDLEDQLYEETQAAIDEKTATLTQQLQLTSTELEEERRRREEAKAREEEAKAREEEAKAGAEEANRQKLILLERAVKALTESGMTEEEARSQLGL